MIDFLYSLLAECKVTFKVIDEVTAAENRAKVVANYDENAALRKGGLKELSPHQLQLFNSWWDRHYESMRDSSRDNVLYWLMTDRTERLKLKAMLKLDDDKDLMNLRGLKRQLFFNSVAWITACRNYMRYYGEPDDLIKAKFDAIRSLSPGL